MVEIHLLDPTKLVSKGEAGMAPLAVLSCSRANDWIAPGKMVILENEKRTLTLTIEIVGDEEEGE